MKTETKIHAQKASDFRKGVEIAIVKTNRYGGRVAYGQVEWKEIDDSLMLPLDSVLSISETNAQYLMDCLWDSGLRPSEGTGSAGSLKKAENHLADMRKLVSRAYKVEL